MAMDLTEPIPALVLTPTRLLRLALFVAASGVAALLVAVGVLVWTYSGLRPDSQQQTVPADMSSKPVAAAPAEALAPEPVPGPVAAPPAPALHPPPVPTRRSCGTRRWPRSPRPPRQGRPRPRCRAGVPARPFRRSACPAAACRPSTGIRRPIARTAERQLAGLFWASGSGGGGGAPTGATIGSATAIGTLSWATTHSDLLNTLILANSGFYGGRPTTSIPGVGLPGPATVARQLLPRPPSVGLPKLPAAPQLGLPKLPPPPRSLPPPPHCLGSGSVSPAHRSGSDSDSPTPRRARTGYCRVSQQSYRPADWAKKVTCWRYSDSQG